MQHADVQPGSVHTPFNWLFASDAARLAATGFAAGDVSKVAVDLDTGEQWRVSAVDGSGVPSWQRLSDPALNVAYATAHGVVADGGLVTDVAVTSGTNVATSATAAWKAGQMVVIVGAGVGGAHFYGTISSVNPITNAATLSANASTTVSGAEASYATDNFSNWMAMEAQLPAGATIVHPWGDMGFSDTPTSSKPLTLLGQGVVELFGGTTAFNDSNWPSVAPYLIGSVFVQFGAGKDIFLGSVVGRSQNIVDLGFRFAGRYSNTGTGLNLNPASSNVVGNIGGQVIRAKVFGTDGGHYGINAVAFIAMHFDNPRCYGGGGLRIYNGAIGFGQPGNSTFVNPYAATYIGGSAHAFEIDNSGAGSTWTSCKFGNPQFSIDTQNPAIPGTSNPTNVQHMYHVTGTSTSIVLFGFENPGGQSQVSGSKAFFPTGNGCWRTNDPFGGSVGNTAMTTGPASGAAVQNLTGKSQEAVHSFLLTPAAAATAAGTLAAQANAGASSISVTVISGAFAAGQGIQIVDAGGTVEFAVVSSVSGAGPVTINLVESAGFGLALTHASGATVQAGAAVVIGQNSSSGSFPGTQKPLWEGAEIGSHRSQRQVTVPVPTGWFYRLDWANATRMWTENVPA